MARSIEMATHLPVKPDNEFPAWSEENDRVPLKRRLKMLLAKDEDLVSAMSPIGVAVKKEDDDPCASPGFNGEATSDGAAFEQSRPGSFEDVSTVCVEIPEDFLDDLDHIVLKERRRMLLSRETLGSIKPTLEHDVSNLSTAADGVVARKGGIGSQVCGKRSVEKLDENAHAFSEALESGSTVRTSASPLFRNVKIEPLGDDIKTWNEDDPRSRNATPVKTEAENDSEVFDDIIDHMLLGDRMKLLSWRRFPESICFENVESPTGRVGSGPDCGPGWSESSKPLLMKRPRKRRRTVTDSVETALEEDAPGLLQVLIEKGVLVDEIKLYGENDGDEASDGALVEESFSELEDVISKVFCQRQSLLKLAPIRCTRGERASYCLACLVSLVEQARYLRCRKWPVEWGWCRDLQSFIFVFERHNRIVLERPEYGYATYFFQLVDTLPVRWQINRLVTAMKLTSCSRITLIENRALMVGDDLTEGEARVLMGYGWVPDSGLGTMLNYCDRVFHDRRQESDTSEWRSRIGKLLTDGYNGGTIVPNDIPTRLVECGGGDFQIKLEQ